MGKTNNFYKNAIVLIATLIFSVCSLLYSLSVSYFLSLLYGNTITIYSLTIGTYMLFLGMGAFLYNKLDKIYGFEILLYTEMLLVVIAFFAPLIISYISVLEINYNIKLLLGFGVLALIGVLSGIELPLLMGLADDSDSMAKIIGIDYLGGLTGSLLYVFLFLPHINTVRTFHVIALINFITVILFFIFYKKALNEKPDLKKIIGFILFGLILFSFSNKVVKKSEYYFLNKRIQLKVYL